MQPMMRSCSPSATSHPLTPEATSLTPVVYTWWLRANTDRVSSIKYTALVACSTIKPAIIGHGAGYGVHGARTTRAK